MWSMPVVLTEWENDQDSKIFENHDNPHESSQIIHCWKQEHCSMNNHFQILRYVNYIFGSLADSR